jgi:hypothetical protein
MMDDSQAKVLILIVLVLTTFLLLFNQKGGPRRFIEDYVKENHLDVVIERRPWALPMRLWFKGRKFDTWFRLRYADGQVKWARIRPTLNSHKLELFD